MMVGTTGLVARRQLPGSLNPVPEQSGTTMRRIVRTADVSGVRTVRGVVLDQRSHKAVHALMRRA